MTDRTAQRLAFVEAAGWGTADLSDLAGDASNRRYFRLRQTEEKAAILMDAPTEKGEDVRPFVKVAAYLRAAGLSAPEVYAEDSAQGFLLLEDLGDDLFARVVLARPELELPLYTAATDVLVRLHEMPVPGDIETYSPDVMADLAALAFDWYQLGITGSANPADRKRFTFLFRDMLTEICLPQDVLIQRDYHAENLLWLPDRQDVSRVGLLDFQDAMEGHRAYDLVSLLQDARRDVSAPIEPAMIRRYVDRAGVDPEAFQKAYFLLGVQRNLRILGVFARLCVRDGKSHYVDLIPRVWGHLQTDLKNVGSPELEALVLQAMPLPCAENLKILKSKCATIPKL